MGAFSIWHVLVWAFWLVIVGFPVSRILTRLGYSPWWTIVAFVPILNLAGLWVLSYARWDTAKAEVFR